MGFQAGDEVGRYRLERKLGEGGMGTVWVALQAGLGRRVALKLLHPAFTADATVVERFRREAELAASLGHPNIVQVTDFGVHDGRPFLVMDMLEGESLAGRIAQGPMPPDRLAFIAAQILAALEAAHAREVVHRDLKPDNVFLTSLSGVRDIVKLLDFGIARLLDRVGDQKMTTTGQVLGTPAYMSPEQARGQEVDVRSDLYAVGVVMYEGLSGRLPFSGGGYHQLMFAIVDETPPALSELREGLPTALVEVVERAMQKDPDARFQTAAEMREALEHAVPTRVRGHSAAPSPIVVAPEPVVSSAPAAFAATMATPQAVGPITDERSPVARGVIAAALVLLGAGLAVGGTLMSRTNDAEPTLATAEQPGADLAPANPSTANPSTPNPAELPRAEVAEPGPEGALPTEEVANEQAPSADDEIPATISVEEETARSTATEAPRVGAPAPPNRTSMSSRMAAANERTRMIPCGPNDSLREHVIIRRSDEVSVSFLAGNHVVPLAELRPRVQSDDASAQLTACYVGHPLNPGQRIDFRVTASGVVDHVSVWPYCPVEPVVQSCISRWLRSVDFSGVVEQPGEMRMGIGL